MMGAFRTAIEEELELKEIQLRASTEGNILGPTMLHTPGLTGLFV